MRLSLKRNGLDTLFKEVRVFKEGKGGLRGENSGASPKAEPMFQQPFSLPENAQTLAGSADTYWDDVAFGIVGFSFVWWVLFVA